MNLSDYLAKDCPEDDCNYVLHSVLVHIGDVGGGHYICFIRPSYGYDYAATSVNMMDIQNWERRNLDSSFLSVRESEMYRGKWFKFNDESVTVASREEAMESNFGFEEEARIKNAYPDGDLVLLTLTKDNCRFIGERYGKRRGRSPTTT
jgi:hypothetical protein